MRIEKESNWCTEYAMKEKEREGGKEGRN